MPKLTDSISLEREKGDAPMVAFTNIPALDGVRGIAIVVVMVYHLEWLLPELHPYVKGGFLGVDVFFVLSGFLITSILLSEYGKTGKLSLKNFYVRRSLRLIPAFWLFLICLYLFGTYLLPPFQASLVFGRYDFLFAITYTMNWFSATSQGFDSNLNHAWSLAIEEQFYILWSLVLYKAFGEKKTRKQILYATVGFIVVLCISRAVRAVLGTDTRVLYYSTDTRIDSILIGCAVSMTYSWGIVTADFLKTIWIKLICCVSLVALMIVLFSFSHEDVTLYIIGLPIFTVSIAILLFWLVNNEGTMVHSLLENRVLCWVGKISYGLYLWHYLFYEYAKKEFYTPESQIFVGVTLAFAVSVISYYLLEKPFLRLKSRFSFQANDL